MNGDCKIDNLEINSAPGGVASEGTDVANDVCSCPAVLVTYIHWGEDMGRKSCPSSSAFTRNPSRVFMSLQKMRDILLESLIVWRSSRTPSVTGASRPESRVGHSSVFRKGETDKAEQSMSNSNSGDNDTYPPNATLSSSSSLLVEVTRRPRNRRYLYGTR